MKVMVDGQEVLNLNNTKKKVIRNDIKDEEFDNEMKRRVAWVLQHKYERCFERLKKEWDKKLKDNGVDMIPTDPDAYAELVFSQPNYKNRSAREVGNN